MSTMVWSFIIVLVAIIATGTVSILRKKKTTEDYLVAGRRVKPWLTALSAVGTNNSGFMFIGMIGYTYRLGIQSIWMMLGFIVGDYVAWWFIHGRVRKKSEETDVKTLAALLGTWKGGRSHAIVVAGSVITLIFLATHAAGQLKAGSTALHALFGWPMWSGAAIGTAIVILYSYAGGIRADIWTDAAQSAVMFGSMLLILVAGYLDLGGPAAVTAELKAQDPDLLNFFPDDLAFGLPLYLTGFMFGGLCAPGQPHLMTRFISIDSVDSIPRARKYYFGWYVPFSILAIGVGLYCRALIPELDERAVAQPLTEPTELALPLLAMDLLPGVFVGIALAGIFAATISTADSQIIVCSGALTQEITTRWKESYVASKTATLVVTAFSLTIALAAPEGVFGIILIAWSAMGASLGVVLVLRLIQTKLSAIDAIAAMAVGVVTVIAWHVSGYDADVFKAFPGIAAAFAAYGISYGIRRWWSRRSS